MTYACTYMGNWESELFQRCENRPSSYYRYIDDIWGIWNHGEEKLLEFIRTANEIHPNIKLESRYSKQTIECLDVQRARDGKGLFWPNLKITFTSYTR